MRGCVDKELSTQYMGTSVKAVRVLVLRFSWRRSI